MTRDPIEDARDRADQQRLERKDEAAVEASLRRKNEALEDWLHCKHEAAIRADERRKVIDAIWEYAEHFEDRDECHAVRSVAQWLRAPKPEGE